MPSEAWCRIVPRRKKTKADGSRGIPRTLYIAVIPRSLICSPATPSGGTVMITQMIAFLWIAAPATPGRHIYTQKDGPAQRAGPFRIILKAAGVPSGTYLRKPGPPKPPLSPGFPKPPFPPFPPKPPKPPGPMMWLVSEVTVWPFTVTVPPVREPLPS